MALPLGGVWPPPPHEVEFAQQTVWSAWLTGDPELLVSAYADAGGVADRTGFFDQGGLRGALARFFWGRPSPAGGRRSKLHVPLAADIATASADLLFSEPPQFMLAGEETPKKAAGATATLSSARKRLDEVLNHGNFHAQLLEAAEIVAALGGGWLRLVWDKDLADAVMVDTVPADAAYGEWRMGRLRAVTFFTEIPADKKVLRHLERHEPGWILHGLYDGEKDQLGKLISLETHPDTAPYAEFVAEGVLHAAIETGVRGLTAAYVANMRPQRRWRKIEPLQEIGRSDYDGVEPLMDALDETYTSWMRDLRLAKARLIVPEFMLKDLGKGKGAAWDEDQEVFTQLKIAPTEVANQQITPQQFEIRFEAHLATADQLIDHILESAGYSPSTFGRGGEGDKTATEVVSRERQSARTRDKKTRYWSQALEPLLSTWLELDGLVFGGGGSGEVVVQWPDASQPDPEALARTVNTLRQAEAASTETLVRMQHPDWDEEEIAKEVAAIRAEGGRDVPDIGPLPFDEVGE